MYKISKEAKEGMHATPEQMGEMLEGLPNDITRCSSECPFSVKIRVLPSTLTPLELEAFNIEAWETWYNDEKDVNPYVPVPGEKGEEKITIEIAVEQRAVESLYVEIIRIAPDTVKSGEILKRFQLAPSDGQQLTEGKGSVAVGIYRWEWDGYINEVLDTKRLKDETTYVRAVGVIGSAFRDDAVQLLAQPFKECAEPVDWLDVRVDRGAKTIDVEWRVAFDDGGVSGKANADTPSFADLTKLALEGIKKHWGGQINTAKGSYAVRVNPVLATEKAAPSLTLQVEMGSSYNRSVNASCACGTLAKLGRGLGNLFSDVTRVWYLQGYYTYNGIKTDAYNDFMMTAAHESGHSILASYAYKSTGLSNYSWVHKGSSKGVGSGYSTPKRGEKGYEPYPSVEADLMKYYSYPEGNFNPANFISTEYDIKNLIWLTQLNLRG
ncbi:hypothetical protein [Aggregatibacter actinomycetemcomitans]|uniref:hypothetical protein n=1 Tax=Aggregatibacter actinomycetemcomitans TaxID=714 RepID=UPI00197C297F|nr:hypothetical protein [Aggregatibacter actinomycetemcomitans]MBN6064055.1 hypothetical protein [Aggregatibacter actinomycetemcomitans]MBN6083956.1 hypothetical protein [Aggregatibacter actinomycetemcomitans]